MSFCKNCGSQVDPLAAICVKCGFSKGMGNTYCGNCGRETIPGASVCTNCGVPLSNIPAGYQQKSKLVAGLLGIFFGYLGVHNFYLGKNGLAVAQILVSVFTCGIGGIWGFIEGIMILVGAINVDGNNIPLKD